MAWESPVRALKAPKSENQAASWQARRASRSPGVCMGTGSSRTRSRIASMQSTSGRGWGGGRIDVEQVGEGLVGGGVEALGGVVQRPDARRGPEPLRRVAGDLGV